MYLFRTLQKLLNTIIPALPQGAENINHCAFASCFSESWYEQPESSEDFNNCQNSAIRSR